MHLVLQRWLGRTRGEVPVPPESMNFVGAGDFVRVGDKWLDYFVNSCSLAPDAHVLDIGCGIGRIARPLTTHLNEDAVYRGFDIVEEGITWCQQNITTRHKNFQFIQSDVHNEAYNPTGRHKASDYRFPYDDDSFDFAFLTSVFTHMYPADVENYLNEIARVMRPGATSVITYFLLNDESRRLMASPKCTLNFADEISPVCWTARIDVPENALGFTESYIDGLYESAGLTLIKPKVYGTWCTGRPSKFYQDVIVATKA